MGRKILVGLAVVGLAVFGWSQMSVAATFSNADFSGTWSFYCDCQQEADTFNGWVYGTMESDGAGNITGGTGTNSLGESITVPPATYTLNSDGTMTITLTDMTIHAAMNDGKDVIATVETSINCGGDNHTEYGHGVAIKNQGVFDGGDFNGTWNMYTAWQDKDAVNNGWVYGPITSDGAGGITAGTTLTFQDGTTDTIVAGSTYTVNANGTMTVVTLNLASGVTVDVIGAMNDGKDVVGIVYTVADGGVDIAYGAGTIIKNQGGFDNSNFASDWSFYLSSQEKDAVDNGWVYGTLTSNGAGVITGGQVTDEGDGGAFSPIPPGTYTVNANGTMTISISGTTLIGAMADLKDVVGFVHTHTNTETPAAPVTGGGGGGGGCFIATASFGTPMAEEVKALTKFRDEVLLKTTAGRDFVELYYKTSPPIANFIRNKPALKAMVRIGLKPLVWFSRLVK